MLIAPVHLEADTYKAAVCAAFRACYEGVGLKQDGLAAASGIPQPTISRWARGASVPDPVSCLLVERACDDEGKRLDGPRRPDGWILVQAGLVELPTSVADAVAMDPALNDDARSALLKGYRGAVEHVRAIRRAVHD